MPISLRRRSPTIRSTPRRAAAALLGATAILVVAPNLVPAANAQVGGCVNGAGDPVPCPTDPPPTVPPTVPQPTLPRPTNPPPTNPPPTNPPPTNPPPATVRPQAPTPTTDRTPSTPAQVPATPEPTAASAPPTTKATVKPKRTPKPTTTSTSTTTSTTEPDRLIASPLGRVGPPAGGGDGTSPMTTIAAIAGAALLLVLGILGPELRDRFGRRPSAV